MCSVSETEFLGVSIHEVKRAETQFVQFSGTRLWGMILKYSLTDLMIK
jgi:hypothetical protein